MAIPSIGPLDTGYLYTIPNFPACIKKRCMGSHGSYIALRPEDIDFLHEAFVERDDYLWLGKNGSAVYYDKIAGVDSLALKNMLLDNLPFLYDIFRVNSLFANGANNILENPTIQSSLEYSTENELNNSYKSYLGLGDTYLIRDLFYSLLKRTNFLFRSSPIDMNVISGLYEILKRMDGYYPVLGDHLSIDKSYTEKYTITYDNWPEVYATSWQEYKDNGNNAFRYTTNTSTTTTQHTGESNTPIWRKAINRTAKRVTAVLRDDDGVHHKFYSNVGTLTETTIQENDNKTISGYIFYGNSPIGGNRYSGSSILCQLRSERSIISPTIYIRYREKYKLQYIGRAQVNMNMRDGSFFGHVSSLIDDPEKYMSDTDVSIPKYTDPDGDNITEVDVSDNCSIYAMNNYVILDPPNYNATFTD